MILHELTQTQLGAGERFPCNDDSWLPFSRRTETKALRLKSVFARGAGHGLLCLGADEVGSRLPLELSYWREFAAPYVTALCALPGISDDGSGKPTLPPPPDEDLREFAAGAPPMTGAEYLTPTVLADLWRVADAAFDVERAEARLPVQAFLKTRHPAWNLIGRACISIWRRTERMTRRRSLSLPPTRRVSRR